MQSYTVHVGEQTFRLDRSSITFDAPNFFTQAFLGDELDDGRASAKASKKNTSAAVSSDVSVPLTPENDGSSEPVGGSKGKSVADGSISVVSENIDVSTQTSANGLILRELTIDRDPRLFEVILRYLRGYTIFPLSSVNLPPGMSLDLFRESLLEDARFYGLERLARLLQAETPTPLRYKDPFTAQDKILLSLRDVPIHREFIRSKLDGSATIEFFTGAVLTIDLNSSDSTIRFQTEILNEQDQKALDVLNSICGENTQIRLSQHLRTGWNMRGPLNGIRLEIDGVQVTGLDIASLISDSKPSMKALEDMFRLAGGDRLVIYAQEFVFRLERERERERERQSAGADEVSKNGVSSESDKDGAAVEDETDHYSRSGDSNASDTIDESNAVDHEGDDPVYLGVVWAKGWTQDWWAWNEYRMKLDTLQ